MPTHKAFILNKEIIVNYEENQKEKLLEAINEINFKLENYDNNNGKISDSKLLSFLAIKLQAELFDLNKNQKKETILKKNIEDHKSENIALNDKIFKLREQNEILEKENKIINQEIIKIKKQIDIITNLVKKVYE